MIKSKEVRGSYYMDRYEEGHSVIINLWFTKSII